MKIKETEIKNSKSHALAYLNPSLFCFLGSGGLYPLKKIIYAVIPAIMLFYMGHTIEVFKFESIYF